MLTVQQIPRFIGAHGSAMNRLAMRGDRPPYNKIYHSAEVLYVSLHAGPNFAFPCFSGYRNERGDGRGYNLSLAGRCVAAFLEGITVEGIAQSS